MLANPFNLTNKTNKKNNQKISRLIASSDSIAIAKISTTQNIPLLVIVNDAYSINRIYNELKLFAPDKTVATFADSEVLPYEKTSPQKELTASRLKTLWQINLNQLDIVIIQAQTLQAKLPPISYLNRMLLFKIGDKVSLASMRQQLISSDYSLVKQVLEPGEFTVRGGILDIIPMGQKNLIRVELFDDEIEELTIINPKTLAVINKATNIQLIPAREYPIDQESLDRFAKKLQHTFPEAIDKHLLTEIANGLLPPGSEFYLPLFFETTGTIFDYMEANWGIVYFETLPNKLNINWQEITRRYNLYSYQYPCLKPIDLFTQTEALMEQISRHKNFEILETGELNNNIRLIPQIGINNRQINPAKNLKDFINTCKQKIVLVVNSLGRIEVLRNTLNNYDIQTNLIHTLTDMEQIPTNSIVLLQADLHNGFICNNIVFLTEYDLYSVEASAVRKRNKVNSSNIVNVDNSIRNIAELEINDYVVHLNYGIGKYLGLKTQNINDIEYEMLELEYQNESRLFIPVQNLYLISKYSHLDNAKVELHKLGSNSWSKIKAKAEKKVNDVAAELLDIYAKRELEQGTAFTIPKEYVAFANSFGYTPTIDQENCFNAIIADMQKTKPMDRLICGDVGFGKTEVAIRAAFIAAMNGKQVAILVPTTLLAEQHYQNFVDRFAEYPIVIAEISRFKTKKEVLETLELVKLGRIDILIGTHRLIQADVKFANLGLVIIDEEHRFGVKQKEKFKQLRSNTDFLAMTATPIPRSLSMALDGIRDFSIIATPPQKRLAVNTIICNYDKQLISEAILRETRRGGQIFFLYNDVATINKMYDELQLLMPNLNIAIAHGQMQEQQLEQVIKDFIRQKYNLLLCSTIIETGIDIANANTIFIYNANKFGLAALHQLRGRVGRSHHQAYCYLVIPEKLTTDASKRLDAISNTQGLGSGFNLALYDLEIRGAGEILGENQSGNIKEVGLSLYSDMLRQAVRRLKKANKELNSEELMDMHCEVNLHTTCILPNEYCNNVHHRLIFYKRLSQANSVEEIDVIYQEIIDKYGIAPISVKNLINSHYLRIKAANLGIVKLDVSTKSIHLSFSERPIVEPLKIVSVMQELKHCTLDNKNKLTWHITATTINDKIVYANKIIDKLT